MKEGEDITKYSERIKKCFNAIRATSGTIEEETLVIKLLRTLLPIYAIRVSSIQEMRCTIDVTLDTLVGRLATFELDNFDNYSPNPSTLESSFKAKLNLSKKDRKGKQIDSNNSDDEDL